MRVEQYKRIYKAILFGVILVLVFCLNRMLQGG
jgi:hypothetical protein